MILGLGFLMAATITFIVIGYQHYRKNDKAVAFFSWTWAAIMISAFAYLFSIMLKA